MPSFPRKNAQQSPTSNFGALGALSFLCGAAFAVAAVLSLLDGTFIWPWFVLTLLSIVVGVGFMWLGDWANAMETRMSLHEEGLDDIPHAPDNADAG